MHLSENDALNYIHQDKKSARLIAVSRRSITLNKFGKRARGCCVHVFLVYGKILGELKIRCDARGEAIDFTIAQLRNKFKKCVSECKHAAMTIKTATGINRFQEDKGYGAWFKHLFPVVQSRDSCRPEMSAEPSASSGTTSTSSCDPICSEAIIVWLVALTRSVVRATATQTVFQRTTFQRTKLLEESGRVSSRDTGEQADPLL